MMSIQQRDVLHEVPSQIARTLENHTLSGPANREVHLLGGSQLRPGIHDTPLISADRKRLVEALGALDGGTPLVRIAVALEGRGVWRRAVVKDGRRLVRASPRLLGPKRDGGLRSWRIGTPTVVPRDAEPLLLAQNR